MLNYMNQMLIVKDWNYLATHLKKLVRQKCVATPWLRATGLVSRVVDFAVLVGSKDSCNFYQTLFTGTPQQVPSHPFTHYSPLITRMMKKY